MGSIFGWRRSSCEAPHGDERLCGELHETISLGLQTAQSIGCIHILQAQGRIKYIFGALEFPSEVESADMASQDVVDPWFVVFRLMDKDDLNKATGLRWCSKAVHLSLIMLMKM